jgi:DNA-binding LacI/PurR family transcriptional regulator
MDGSSIRPDSPADPLLAAGTQASAWQMASSLIDAGHRRLAVVAPNADESGPAAMHLRDLCAALSAAQLPPARLIDVGKDLDRAFFGVFRGTRYPTGLVCPDAATATAALRSLRALGFRVPGDLTVVWFAEPATMPVHAAAALS